MRGLFSHLYKPRILRDIKENQRKFFSWINFRKNKEKKKKELTFYIKWAILNRDEWQWSKYTYFKQSCLCGLFSIYSETDTVPRKIYNHYPWRKQRIICLVKMCSQKLGSKYASAHKKNQLYFSPTVRMTSVTLLSAYCVKSTGWGAIEKKNIIYDINGVTNTCLPGLTSSRT